MKLDFLDYFIIFVLIIIVVFYIKKYYGEVEYVKSSVNGETYLVRKLPNKHKAADMLAQLSEDCKTLIKHLVAKYPDNEDVLRLYGNFGHKDMSEGSPESGYTSYSVNKDTIVLCLRQKENPAEFADTNVIRYVLYHELGHLMTASIGHTKEFWDNFKFILKEAVEIGVYQKIDYAKQPMPYCGIKVTSSVI
jgi:predicted metal-dependent hydrolase